MSIVVVMQPDPFAKQFEDRAKRAKLLQGFGATKDFSHVRRPWRGISIKEDTWATLEVFDSKGTPLPFFDSGGPILASDLAQLYGASDAADDQISALGSKQRMILDSMPNVNQGTGPDRDVFEGTNDQIQKIKEADTRIRKSDSQLDQQLKKNQNIPLSKKFGAIKGDQAVSLRYSNFVITSASETRQEKFQVMETFGNPYIFFFGEKPRIYQFSGVLVNSLDFQWRAEWWANYDNLIRGTKLVENDARVVLTWDDVVVEGYILQAQAVDSDQQPYLIQFQFQLFVTNYYSTAPIADPKFPRPFSVSVDTSMWVDGASNRALPASPNTTDALRRQNIGAAVTQASENSLGQGFQSFIRQAADVLSSASYAQSLITRFVSAYRQQFATVRRSLTTTPSAQTLASNSTRVLQTLNALPSTLDQDINDFVDQQITSPARRLVAKAAGSVYQAPEYVVQEQDIIIGMTREYARQTDRRVPLLSGSNLVPVTGGSYRDNVDEFAQALSSKNPLAKRSSKELTNRDKANNLDAVMDTVLKTASDAGVSLSSEPTKSAQSTQLQGGLLTRMTIAPINESIKGSVGAPDPYFANQGDVAAAQRVSTSMEVPPSSANRSKVPANDGTVANPRRLDFSNLDALPKRLDFYHLDAIPTKKVGSRPAAKTNQVSDEEIAKMDAFIKQLKRPLEEQS